MKNWTLKQVGRMVMLATCVAIGADPADSPSARLKAVERFAYQLQNLDVAAAGKCDADMIIVDPQTDEGRLTPKQVQQLQLRNHAAPRLILAYLSIGEAEDYRPYWQAEWKQKPPSWLGPENPDWKGNYKVQYWDPQWQKRILGSPQAALDQIIADGYDGVYLDIVDGFEFWEQHDRQNARLDMVKWVAKISAHAKKARSGFLVIPQNGEALSAEPGYLATVDGLGREDLFFDGDRKQKPADVKDVVDSIKRFQNAGKPVFVIHYCKRLANCQEVEKRSTDAGYVSLLTVRALDKLIVSEAPER